MSSELRVLTTYEWGGPENSTSSPGPGPPERRLGRRSWLAVGILATVWAGLSLIPDGGVLNVAGWPQLSRFWAAAVRPETSPEFLATVWDATLTTLAFAVLGTVLAVLGGAVAGVLVSETWWSGRADRMAAPRRAGWALSRVSLSLPRGVHEAVWALFLLAVLGRDPLVGVLAIAIPFGAITAKVYAEMIDEADHAAYDALRRLGARRLPALLYGILPGTTSQLTSYAFYRFECSIRSAVILGMIGAGGLGFQLMLSFQGLVYQEIWTVLYALMLLSAAVDYWGSALRSREGDRRLRHASLVVLVVAVVGSWVHLAPDLPRLASERSRSLFDDTVSQMLPPALPSGGMAELWQRSVETVQMSLLAGVIATSAAVAVCFVAARGSRGPYGAAVSLLARGLLLLCRAIPAPVWAVLVLFVMLPGPLPGAVALGVYNFGILGRLCAEVVENLDPAPREALARIGATPTASFLYATVPTATNQFLAYGLYRWEVAMRETVVLGVVGAGGLGLLLQQQRAAFDLAGMTASVAALVVLSTVVDLVGAAVRRSLR